MPDMLVATLLWFSSLACGLLAGVYFAFSAFIMGALGRIEPRAGIAAMNRIDLDIQRSLFMALFLGSTLAAAMLVGLSLFDGNTPYAMPTLVGGVIYLLGMFGVTMVWNVPLNNALAAAEGTPEAEATWTRYLRVWTRWNHVRTLASLAACALHIRAIALL